MTYNQTTVRVLAVCFALVLAFIIAVANMGLGVKVYGHLCQFQYFDKVGHFVLMGGFSFLVNLSLNGKKVRLFKRPVLLGSLLVFAFVLFEECTQLWMPHRNFQISDLIFDALGIFFLGRAAALLASRHQAGTVEDAVDSEDVEDSEDPAILGV